MEIPAVTVIEYAPAEILNGLLEKSVRTRAPGLLITDLYRCDFDQTTKLFSFNQFRFKEVAIAGQVISKTPWKDGCIIEVDDHTAKISVFCNTSEKNILVDEIDKLWNISNTEFSSSNNNTIEMARWMLRDAKKRLATRADPTDIAPGEIVHIWGKLRDYEGQRKVFANVVKKIVDNKATFRVDWAERCLIKYVDNTSFFNNQWADKYDIPDKS